MMETLPNPALEGYRTAHEQNKDGSYGIRVMPADLKCHKSGGSRRIYRGKGVCKPSIPELYTPPTGSVIDSQHKRIMAITEKMEEVYRMRHHDFYGKSEAETARVMNMKPSTIRRLLWRMCKIAPQLFPILTPRQAQAWHLWHQEGMPHYMIAGTMGISVNASEKLVKRAKKKLGYHHTLYQRLRIMDPRQLAALELNAEIVQIF